MFRIAIATAGSLALCACAQLQTASEPTPTAAARLEASPMREKEAKTLNHLTRIAIDANTLYGEAAAEADDAQLQTELTALASSRKEFATDLQRRVATLGADPAENGQAIGSIHRSFTAARALVQNDSVAAAGEVYRGESYMIDELSKVLADADLTAESRQLLQAELNDVTAGRDRVEQIKTRIETRLENERAREQTLDGGNQPG